MRPELGELTKGKRSDPDGVRACILSANLIRLDKFGHPCAACILVEDIFLAKATYDAACKR
jgi:hypothetical protein